jgi:hypothetical protein
VALCNRTRTPPADRMPSFAARREGASSVGASRMSGMKRSGVPGPGRPLGAPPRGRSPGEPVAPDSARTRGGLRGREGGNRVLGREAACR